VEVEKEAVGWEGNETAEAAHYMEVGTVGSTGVVLGVHL
jgi:hypothetical protein